MTLSAGPLSLEPRMWRAVLRLLQSHVPSGWTEQRCCGTGVRAGRGCAERPTQRKEPPTGPFPSPVEEQAQIGLQGMALPKRNGDQVAPAVIALPARPA